MVEPLDAATLARLASLQTSGEATDYDFAVWVLDNADTIEALARDHARLTAENERLLNLLRGWERLTPDEAGRIPAQAGYWLAERSEALSAEAGDQGTWMGGGLEITYPSAEAGDTDG